MKKAHWAIGEESNDALVSEAVALLMGGGADVITPTKVGYIIMTNDRVGLSRKFDLKNRSEGKPGVVLLSSVEQLKELAQVNEKILQLYHNCWNDDVLLGCILPWNPDAAKKFIPNDGSAELMMDKRNTSCFVIKYGVPSEMIARKMWMQHGRLSFASSANPSGQGNRGRFDGIGDRILDGVDLAIECDDYVRSQQPQADETSRWHQGVMVSMVDEEGKLTDAPPAIIRRGLVVEKIEQQLIRVYNGYENRPGGYH